MYRLQLTDVALQDLAKLDKQIALRILKKTKWFCAQSDPLAFAKTLTGEWLGSYRFRVGDYRVIFEVEDSGTINILYVLRVKNRKDVYDL